MGSASEDRLSQVHRGRQEIRAQETANAHVIAISPSAIAKEIEGTRFGCYTPPSARLAFLAARSRSAHSAACSLPPCRAIKDRLRASSGASPPSCGTLVPTPSYPDDTNLPGTLLPHPTEVVDGQCLSANGNQMSGRRQVSAVDEQHAESCTISFTERYRAMDAATSIERAGRGDSEPPRADSGAGEIRDEQGIDGK